MIKTLSRLPESAAQNAWLRERGFDAATTKSASRLEYPDPVATPPDEETTDFGEPGSDHQACIKDVDGRGVSTSTSPLEGKWDAELKKLETLREGWNGYDAPTPTRAAIDAARQYLQVVHREGLEPKRVEPSVMGGVGITHRQGSRKVYVEFYNNGTVHSLLSDGSGKMQTMPVRPSAEDVRRFVAKAKDYLNARDSS
jgi:hypothetical protein